MKITPGVKFDTAVELPVGTERPSAKSVGNKGGNNGAHGGKGDSWRRGDSQWEKSKFFADEKKADMAITQENKMVMVLLPSGKRRFVRQSDLYPKVV